MHRRSLSRRVFSCYTALRLFTFRALHDARAVHRIASSCVRDSLEIRSARGNSGRYRDLNGSSEKNIVKHVVLEGPGGKERGREREIRCAGRLINLRLLLRRDYCYPDELIYTLSYCTHFCARVAQYRAKATAVADIAMSCARKSESVTMATSRRVAEQVNEN